MAAQVTKLMSLRGLRSFSFIFVCFHEGRRKSKNQFSFEHFEGLRCQVQVTMFSQAWNLRTWPGQESSAQGWHLKPREQTKSWRGEHPRGLALGAMLSENKGEEWDSSEKGVGRQVKVTPWHTSWAQSRLHKKVIANKMRYVIPPFHPFHQEAFKKPGHSAVVFQEGIPTLSWSKHESLPYK